MSEEQRPAYYAPDPRDMASGETASVLAMTDPSKIVERLKMQLQGMDFDDEKQIWYLPKGAKPLLNNTGVRSIMTDIQGVMNQNTTLSNLDDEKQINFIMLGKIRTISTKLYLKFKEFEVDLSELDSVVDLVESTCYMCLRRPWHNLERVFHKATLSEIRHYDPRLDASAMLGKKERKGWGLFGGKK